MPLSRASRLIVVGLATAGLALAAVLPASAGGSDWKDGYYTPSAHGTLSFASADQNSGLADLNFTNQSNTALLVTMHGASKGTLLGDLTSKTITATYTISDVTSDFTYYGEPDGCGTPASARFYFQTDNGGGFQYTHYWWAGAASAVLANGTVTLTATVVPAQWSDWNGQQGSTQLVGFADAASNVTTIGLSFGGGCFYENGVGTQDGSGTFTLKTFNVS